MQMAQAYGTFANGGVMNDAHLITKIENASWPSGQESQPEINPVLSGSTTDKMTNMMLGTFSNGTGLTLRHMAIPWQENWYDRDQL